MSEEQGDVLATLAQRGDPQAEHVEAEIQIAPEGAFGHGLLQDAVGGGENTDVDGNAASAADGANFLFLNGAQKFGLEVDGKLANFVKKHGSALGDRQQSVLSLIGAGERAFDIAEQLALDQRGHERAAVDGDERLVVERPGVVNRARHHFLAGAALSQNQDRVGTVGGFGDDAVELLHFRGTADDAAIALLGLELLAQHTVFSFQLEVIGYALQQELEFIDA